MAKKIYFFFGTIAELIKIFPLILEFKQNNKEYKIISTGQNSLENCDIYKFLDLGDKDIGISSNEIKQSIVSIILWFITTLFKSIIRLRKEFRKYYNKNFEYYLVIHGDTISTLIGAIIGKVYKFKVLHIESGLRSFNFFKPFPEEICRFLVSFLTDIHICPNQVAVNNLTKMRGLKVNTYVNTLIDSLDIAIGLNKHSEVINRINGEKYFVFVLHRQENLLNKKLVEKLINFILSNNNNFSCVLILHKPTLFVLEKMRLLDKLRKSKRIILTPRLNYFEFIKLLGNSEFIVTDGGSNQEESYYLGKPCLLLRDVTERNEGLGENVVLSRNKLEIIEKFFLTYKNYKRNKIKMDKRPSKIIFDLLEN